MDATVRAPAPLDDELRRAHDRYLEAWSYALASGSAEGIEAFLAPGYHGTFATSAAESAGFDAADALAGLRESAAALRGATQSVEGRTLGFRDDGSACVFYAKTLRVGERRIGAFVVEQWVRGADGRWLLAREAAEHGVVLP